MVNEEHTTKPILSKKRHLFKAVTYRIYSWYRVNFGKHKQIKASKEDTIKWMAQRIKDEQRKHSSFFDDWHDIAARKIYATLISKNK